MESFPLISCYKIRSLSFMGILLPLSATAAINMLFITPISSVFLLGHHESRVGIIDQTHPIPFLNEQKSHGEGRVCWNETGIHLLEIP